MTDALDALQRIITRRGTKAEIEAEAGGALEEARLAWASDTDELGVYTDGAWTWVPTSTSITFGTPAVVLGTAAAAGSTDEVIRCDSTIVAFDATAPADIPAPGVASATGSVALAARRDHKHALTYHDEPLTDGASNFIFDGGDVIVVTGVPN